MPYGSQMKFGIARQVSVGSGGAVTAPSSFHHIPAVSMDVGLEKDEVISQNLAGTFDQIAAYDGTSRITGTIEVEALPKALGALLTAAVNMPTVVTSGSLKTLTFTPRSADYGATLSNEPFTMYAQLADSSSAELFFDTQVGQIEFQMTQGQLLRVRANVVGGQRVATGVGSLSVPLDTTDLSAGFLWDVSSLSVGGGAVSNLSDLTVTVNENIAPVYALNGTLLPYKYTRTAPREVTVQGTLMFDSRSMYNDFVAGTQRRLFVTLRNSRVQVQSGYYPTLTLDVPQMRINAMKPSIGGPGEVMVSFTGRGIRDTTSNYVFQATLSNTYAAGY